MPYSRRLLLDLWAGIRGVAVSLSRGATVLGIKAGLAVGRPSQRKRQKPVEIGSLKSVLFIAFGCCICLLHSMHIALVSVANGLSGECS